MADPRIPEFIRFLVFHAGVGFALSILATILIIVTDFSAIGTLISQNEDGPFAATIMALLMGISFSSIQVSVAIMLQANERQPPGDREAGPPSD